MQLRKQQHIHFSVTKRIKNRNKKKTILVFDIPTPKKTVFNFIELQQGPKEKTYSIHSYAQLYKFVRNHYDSG
jgi:hypothetical protein